MMKNNNWNTDGDELKYTRAEYHSSSLATTSILVGEELTAAKIFLKCSFYS